MRAFIRSFFICSFTFTEERRNANANNKIAVNKTAFDRNDIAESEAVFCCLEAINIVPWVATYRKKGRPI